MKFSIRTKLIISFFMVTVLIAAAGLLSVLLGAAKFRVAGKLVKTREIKDDGLHKIETMLVSLHCYETQMILSEYLNKSGEAWEYKEKYNKKASELEQAFKDMFPLFISDLSRKEIAGFYSGWNSHTQSHEKIINHLNKGEIAAAVDIQQAESRRSFERSLASIHQLIQYNNEKTVELYRKIISGYRDDRIKMYAALIFLTILGLGIGVHVSLRISRHITERRRAEDKLNDINKKLARVSQYKSEFLANISHELRTPLTAILAFTGELLKKSVGNISPEQEEYLRDIRESAGQLLNMINDLLDLSKIESGKMELNLTEVSIGDIAREVEKMLYPLADEKNIKINSEINESQAVIADREKVRQVIQNLLANAIKYSPPGSEIHLSVADSDSIVEGVVIKIKDSGPGIPDEHKERIFDAFYQVDRKLNREYRGSGLGLALVKKIVDLHLGEIRLESVQGKGTVFYVFWPAYPAFEDDLE